MLTDHVKLGLLCHWASIEVLGFARAPKLLRTFGEH